MYTGKQIEHRVDGYMRGRERTARGQSGQLWDRVESYGTEWTAMGQSGQLWDRVDSYGTERTARDRAYR